MPARPARPPLRVAIALGTAGVLYGLPLLVDLVGHEGLALDVLAGSLVFLLLLSGPLIMLAVVGETLAPRTWWVAWAVIVGTSVGGAVYVAVEGDPLLALGAILLVPMQCLVVGAAVAWQHLRGPRGGDHGVFTER